MEKQKEINVGVIVRRSPNKSPWLKWSWKPICLLPGSVDKDWKLIREESGIFDFHVGSQILELHRAEVESYKVSLAMEPASAFVIMERDELENEDKEYKLHKVTASAYEAQDYSDSDEYLVEPVPMPQTLQASECAASPDVRESGCRTCPTLRVRANLRQPTDASTNPPPDSAHRPARGP